MSMSNKSLYWSIAGFAMIIIAFVYTDWLITVNGGTIQDYATTFNLLMTAGVVFLIAPVVWKGVRKIGAKVVDNNE